MRDDWRSWWGISPKQSLQLSGYKNGSISIVFNFDTAWENGAFDSLAKKDEKLSTNVINLKLNFARWHKICSGKAWLPLYWTNHDHPRVLSQYGSVYYREQSAKMLITTILFMYGTPFIYYGDEIGMSNVDYSDINDFNDVSAHNFLKENKHKHDYETLLRFLRRTSRVNARTPMQWSDEIYAGFSEVEPCQKVNGNYREVNVNKQLSNPDSILNFFKQAIRLRKQEDILESVLFGTFSFIDLHGDDVVAYIHEGKKKLLVISNFRSKTIKFPINFRINETLLHNYKDEIINSRTVTLRPFECYLFTFEK